jgi:hypothetical protein
MRLGRPKASRRVGENQATVADHRRDEALGCRELGPECCGNAPAKPAGGAERKIAVSLRAGAVLETQLVFVEDQPVGAGHLPDALAQIGG